MGVYKDEIDFRTIKFTVKKGGYQRQNWYITSILVVFDLLKSYNFMSTYILLFVLGQETYI